MNKHASQGSTLVEHMKTKPHTYGDMLRYGVSTSPWKRVAEWLDSGANGGKWRIQRMYQHKANGGRLVAWMIVRA